MLRELPRDNELPWLVLGDFNDVLFANEKQGGRLRDERNMTAFKTVLDECNLLDIGYQGPCFTWEQGCWAHNNIREQLDRGFVDEG